MDPVVMWVLAAAVVVAPLVLLRVFHGSDVSDARGRRHDHRWRS